MMTWKKKVISFIAKMKERTGCENLCEAHVKSEKTGPRIEKVSRLFYITPLGLEKNCLKLIARRC